MATLYITCPETGKPVDTGVDIPKEDVKNFDLAQNTVISIWRRISGGTGSESGSRFVERILTVAATCRQQEINVLEYLTRCYQAHPGGQPIPSLIPDAPAAQAA